ncbi:saccharopine dehydrogenase-like oxidoreductase [Drosophila mojavensis]|uniref:Saccharopine dehydrogenase NADP binding domain-containing protein n=1 Tax=Drosophila mojavensis TaxID=7230 RepID=B4KPY3_DROMO|nr:saccharopine dehydrogenase-like oxidoreductase [Drosophila mojavensis]EDW10260.1 uncharacterized protein Dmoj_GI20982 [Drosophila mojavensis]
MAEEVRSGRLDVVIFGASGFTGKHTVYEAISVLEGLRWGIAGRNREKLEEVLDEMGIKAGQDLSQIPIIIADVSDDNSVLRMAMSARIVVNTVGPFRLYGEAVIRGCLAGGAHLVDVSGEPQYIESMQLKYHDFAKLCDIYVISACGCNSIPADMGVVFAEQHFDGTINSVETFFVHGLRGCKGNTNAGRAGLNYGTWVSAVNSLAHSDQLKALREHNFVEPLPPFYPIMRPRPLIFRSPETNQVCLPYIGADRSVVRRSQEYFYDYQRKRPVQFFSYIGFPSWLIAIAVALFGIIFMILTKFKLGRKLLLKYPEFFSAGYVSRNGPTEAYMERSYFKLILKATGWPSDCTNPDNELPCKTQMFSVSGPNPAYGSTCVGLLAAAVTLLRQSHKMPGTGGVLTPAMAFARTDLISELEKHEHGMKFEILHDEIKFD